MGDWGGETAIDIPRCGQIEITKIATPAAGSLLGELVEQYASRHRVRPGITGWAQVNGWRGETDRIEKIQKRVEYDLYYIENWSIWFDLLIILKTIVVLFKKDDTY